MWGGVYNDSPLRNIFDKFRGNKPSRGVEEDRIATEARRSELLR